MLKPSIELTKNKIISDYSLVVGIAKKAREIAGDAETKGEILEEKPVDLAVQEYIHHQFRIVEPEPCGVCGRIDCICNHPKDEGGFCACEEEPAFEETEAPVVQEVEETLEEETDSEEA